MKLTQFLPLLSSLTQQCYNLSSTLIYAARKRFSSLAHVWPMAIKKSYEPTLKTIKIQVKCSATSSTSSRTTTNSIKQH